MEKNLITGCLDEYKKRPIECILLTLFTIINTFFQDSFDGLLLYASITTITIGFPFAIIVNAFAKHIKWIQKLYELLLPIAIICTIASINERFSNIHSTTEYNTIVFILIIGVIIIDNFKNDLEIIENTLTIIWALMRGCIGAFTAWLSLAIIVFATENIFNTTIEAHILSIPWTLFFPIISLSMYDSADKINSIKNPIANNLLNFAITPALMIFTIVLYIYMAKTLITWELPNGNIVRTTILYFLVAMSASSLYRMAIVNTFNRFYHWIPFLGIPITLFFWIAAIRRIYDYGFTEPRIYMVMIGIVNLVFMYMLFTDRSRAYKITIIHLLAFTFALAYIPQFSSKTIASYLQWKNVNKPTDDLPSALAEEKPQTDDIYLINNCTEIVVPKRSTIYFPIATINNDSIILISDTDTIAETKKETLLRKIAHNNNMNYEVLLDSAKTDFIRVDMNVNIDSMHVVFNQIIYSQFEQSIIVSAAYK